MKGAEAMRKGMAVLLAIGIILILSGIIMAVLHVTPEIIPTTMIAIGIAYIFVCIHNKGGTLIIDEMVKRVDALSGHYSFIASLYFLFALCGINIFYPKQLSVNGLLVTIMLFMSLSFILVRYFLMKRGKTE